MTNRLQLHLIDENFDNIMKLHPHPFGELTRFMYQILRLAVAREADRLIFYNAYTSIEKHGDELRRVDTGSLESIATTTFKAKMRQILESDKTVSECIRVMLDDDDKMVCQISYE